MNDALSNRMKRYENVNRNYLTPRTYTIIRVDGKAFHTFTKKFKRPFDEDLVNMMDMTALYLAKKVQGCKLAYVQSDEISLVLTDFDDLNTSAWFDGNIQKIVSVSASMATAEFNRYLLMNYVQSGKVLIDALTATEIYSMNFAEFDSRTYTIPTKTEVINYLVWRQKDATRNSIAMVAQSLCSVSELKNKNGDQQQELIFQKGQNWNDYDDGLKRGRVIMRVAEHIPVNFYAPPKPLVGEDVEPPMRMKWRVVNPPIFTQECEFLSNLILENQ